MADKRGGVPKSVRQYLQRIGQRGGEARGRAKRRGGPDYYRDLARKRWQAAPD